MNETNHDIFSLVKIYNHHQKTSNATKIKQEKLLLRIHERKQIDLTFEKLDPEITEKTYILILHV